MPFSSSPSGDYTPPNGTTFTARNGGWKVKALSNAAEDAKYEGIYRYLGRNMTIGAAVPTATIYSPFSWSAAASGGTAPYTYALRSGSLPNGLSLNTTTGAVTGTVTVPGGTFSFTIRVTDSTGALKDFAYSITPVAPTITLAAPTTTADTSTAYSSSVAASGGATPYTYAVTSGALPTGLSLNASTGAITGTPSATGSFAATITATDANGFTGSRSVTWTIAAPYAVGSITTVGGWESPAGATPANFWATLNTTYTAAGDFYTVGGGSMRMYIFRPSDMPANAVFRVISHTLIGSPFSVNPPGSATIERIA